MTPEEKIYKVLKKLKGKMDIAPLNSEIKYRAGREGNDLSSSEEILILNKLESEGVIKIIYNAGTEYK